MKQDGTMSAQETAMDKQLMSTLIKYWKDNSEFYNKANNSSWVSSAFEKVICIYTWTRL